MMRRAPVRTRALALVEVAGALALILASAGCEAPASADVLLDLGAFSQNGLPGLRAPTALLEVLDAQGAAVAVEVVSDVDEPTLVQSPLRVPCGDDGRCSLALRVRPGVLRFIMHVEAADRCGARAELLRLASAPIELSPYTSAVVELALDSADFDDDGDGLSNALEHAVCGRFDAPDGQAPPQACADPADPCCAGTSDLEGHMSAFTGGPHLFADGTTSTVAPFAIDDTEVTWRQLARCVASGGCLAQQPDHPARLRLASGVDATLPVTGLLPSEAAAVCAFFAKRLPLDSEWDFVAAHREDAAVRARFPWDGAGEVGCQPAFDGVAANHAVAGAVCPSEPLPVGSYPSSFVERGSGPALADLGGNVAEWTLIAGAAPTIAEIPAGHSAVVLRGGGAASPLLLLENDLPVVARFPANGDVVTWQADIVRLAATAGFRCALDVEDGAVAPSFTDEPACP